MCRGGSQTDRSRTSRRAQRSIKKPPRSVDQSEAACQLRTCGGAFGYGAISGPLRLNWKVLSVELLLLTRTNQLLLPSDCDAHTKLPKSSTLPTPFGSWLAQSRIWSAE